MNSGDTMIVKLSSNRGSVMVFVAGGIAASIAMAALVIDLGYGWVTKNETHNVSDAAALAGARALGKIYVPLPPAQPMNYTAQQNFVLGDPAPIVAQVQDTASKNYAGG